MRIFLTFSLCLSLTWDVAANAFSSLPSTQGVSTRSTAESVYQAQAIPGAGRCFLRTLYLSPLLVPQLLAYKDSLPEQIDAFFPIKTFIVLAVVTVVAGQAIKRWEMIRSLWTRKLADAEYVRQQALRLALADTGGLAGAFNRGDVGASEDLFQNLKRIGQLAKIQDGELLRRHLLTTVSFGPSYRLAIQLMLRRWATSDRDIAHLFKLLQGHVHKDPHQMGRRATADEIIELEGKTYLRLTAAGESTETALRELRGIASGHIVHTLESLTAKTTDRRSRQLVESFVLHMRHFEPPMFSFTKPFKDVFGSVVSKPGNAIVLQRTLVYDSIAVFHETGEYLIKNGQLNLWLEGRRLIVDIAGGTVPGTFEIPLSGEALQIACINSESPHYLLRALQRQMFPKADRKLSIKIALQNMEARRSPVESPETLEHLEFDIRKAISGSRAISRLPDLRAFIQDVRAQHLVAEVAGNAANKNVARAAAPELRRLVPALLNEAREQGPASQALWQAISTIAAAQDVRYLTFFTRWLPDLVHHLEIPDFLNAISGISEAFIRDDQTNRCLHAYLRQLDGVLTNDPNHGLFLMAMLLTQMTEEGRPDQLKPITRRIKILQQAYRSDFLLGYWMVTALGEAILKHGTSEDVALFRTTFPDFALNQRQRKVGLRAPRAQDYFAPASGAPGQVSHSQFNVWLAERKRVRLFRKGSIRPEDTSVDPEPANADLVAPLADALKTLRSDELRHIDLRRIPGLETLGVIDLAAVVGVTEDGDHRGIQTFQIDAISSAKEDTPYLKPGIIAHGGRGGSLLGNHLSVYLPRPFLINNLSTPKGREAVLAAIVEEVVEQLAIRAGLDHRVAHDFLFREGLARFAPPSHRSYFNGLYEQYARDKTYGFRDANDLTSIDMCERFLHIPLRRIHPDRDESHLLEQTRNSQDNYSPLVMMVNQLLVPTSFVSRELPSHAPIVNYGFCFFQAETIQGHPIINVPIDDTTAKQVKKRVRSVVSRDLSTLEPGRAGMVTLYNMLAPLMKKSGDLRWANRDTNERFLYDLESGWTALTPGGWMALMRTPRAQSVADDAYRELTTPLLTALLSRGSLEVAEIVVFDDPNRPNNPAVILIKKGPPKFDRFDHDLIAASGSKRGRAAGAKPIDELSILQGNLFYFFFHDLEQQLATLEGWIKALTISKEAVVLRTPAAKMASQLRTVADLMPILRKTKWLRVRIERLNDICLALCKISTIFKESVHFPRRLPKSKLWRFLKNIEQAIQRAQEMAGRGAVGDQMVIFDLNSTMRQYATWISESPEFADEHIIVRAQLAEPLAPIRGIPMEICEAVHNLNKNARRVLIDRRGKRQITISTFWDKKRGRVALRIADNGPGMREADRQRLLEEGPQPPVDISERHGWGLASVKQMVEAHHGEIAFRSVPNKGTDFTLYFPPAAPPETPPKKTKAKVLTAKLMAIIGVAFLALKMLVPTAPMAFSLSQRAA